MTPDDRSNNKSDNKLGPLSATNRRLRGSRGLEWTWLDDFRTSLASTSPDLDTGTALS